MTDSVVAKTSSVLRDFTVLVQRLLGALVNATSDARNSRETPESVMKQILAKDIELKQILVELEEHQNYQRKIYQVEEGIVQKEKIIEQLAAKLRNAELILEKVVEEAKAKQESMRLAIEGATSVADLVEYAHKISYTTSAPHNWDSRKPLVGYRPPAPQEEHMKASFSYVAVESGKISELDPAEPLLDPRLINFAVAPAEAEEDELDLELD